MFSRLVCMCHALVFIMGVQFRDAAKTFDAREIRTVDTYSDSNSVQVLLISHTAKNFFLTNDIPHHSTSAQRLLHLLCVCNLDR